MASQFTIPDEYQVTYRRILPYLVGPLQKDSKVLESLLLYLKLGGERLARIAIDAFNVSQRQRDVEMIKMLRREAMLADTAGEENDEEDDEDQDEENQHVTPNE